MRHSFLWTGIFAAALVAAGLAAAAARAGVITLDVSGTMSPSMGPTACSPTCTLGGNIVIDNSTGAANSGFVSADVTASGFSPSAGPFTIFLGLVPESGSPNTELDLIDAADNELVLDFDAPTAGSFVGYNGGSIEAGLIDLGFDFNWALSSGSLTPVPEPSSALVLLTALVGLGCVLYIRLLPRRIAPRTV